MEHKIYCKFHIEPVIPNFFSSQEIPSPISLPLISPLFFSPLLTDKKEKIEWDRKTRWDLYGNGRLIVLAMFCNEISIY